MATGVPDPSWEERLKALFQAQGIKPRNSSLYRQAFLHSSYLNETHQAGEQSNEKLEFLGDSVLGLAVSQYLWKIHPGENEGQLSKRKAGMVSERALADWARDLGLGDLLLLGKGEAGSGGREKAALLADCLEAFLAALYLDGGLEAARTWVDRWLSRQEGNPEAAGPEDFKSRLQEWTQQKTKEAPRYKVKSSRGPDHAKVFEVEVLLQDKVRASGKGKSKKEAEQDAARKALQKLSA